MNKLISLILVLSLLLSMTSCATPTAEDTTPVLQATEGIQATTATESVRAESSEPQPTSDSIAATEAYEPPEFTGLNDPDLLRYMEDNIYSGLADSLPNEDYIIENVETVMFQKSILKN